MPRENRGSLFVDKPVDDSWRSPKLIADVRKCSDYHPGNIRHPPKPVGSREYFDELEIRKHFVEFHIPGVCRVRAVERKACTRRRLRDRHRLHPGRRRTLASWTSAAVFGVGDVTVTVFGVIRHLDDAAARGVFRQAAQALRPRQDPWTRVVIAPGRGKNVRHPEHCEGPAAHSFADVRSTTRSDHLRINCTHRIVEGRTAL